MDFVRHSPDSGINVYGGIMKTVLKRLKHTSNELTMLFDLSRQLMVRHDTPADFLAVAIDEIRPYLEGLWNINAFSYNMFNEEYEQVYEFTAYPRPDGEDVACSPACSGSWRDERTYFMNIERDGKKLARVRFMKNIPADGTSRHNLSAIFNTISYIISANMVDVQHQMELALMAKLKQAKQIQ